MPSRTNNIRIVAARIAAQVDKAAAKGITAAAVFLSARLKEVVSTPAPRKRVVSRAGDFYYQAKTRAIRGAPPRKLSGRLRQSITYEVTAAPGSRNKAMSAVVGVKARSNLGWNYPKHLEMTNHKFFAPTIKRYRADLVRIVGQSIRIRGL